MLFNMDEKQVGEKYSVDTTDKHDHDIASTVNDVEVGGA